MVKVQNVDGPFGQPLSHRGPESPFAIHQADDLFVLIDVALFHFHSKLGKEPRLSVG